MAKKKAARATRTLKRSGRAGARAGKKPQRVSWLPKGYPVMSSVAVLDDCAGAIDWYKKVLGARQRLRLDMPGGAVAHCELGFAESVLMVGSPMPPQFPAKSASFIVYVRNCDATYKKAVAAGASSLQEPTDQFYGDRSARFADPFGNEWTVMTHIRDVSVREMKKAMAQMGGGA